MKTLIEFRQHKDELVTKMEGLLTKADEEERNLTEEEENEYRDFDKSLDEANESIKGLEVKEARSKKLAEERSRLDSVEKKDKKLDPADNLKGDEDAFRNFGEFVYSIRAASLGVHDNRLTEMRVQQMKNGVTGGYAIPEQFSSDFLSVTPQEAIVRPRATIIPAGDPPDALFKIPALDQGTNLYGGITVNHDGESDDITESTASLKMIELTPKRLSVYVTLSEEVINNWAAASSVIQTQMRLAVINASEADFLNGNGVNKALGIFVAPGTISYNRATDNQIAYADITGMYARQRLMGGGSPVWVTSQTTIPQLTTIVDAGNNNLWVASVAAGLPPTLMGIPVLYYERSPALGTKGDLMLADFSQYLIKEGSGPTLAMSEHIRFKNNEIAFRLTQRFDGQPWQTTPITLEGAAGNTVGSFVVLDVA